MIKTTDEEDSIAPGLKPGAQPTAAVSISYDADKGQEAPTITNIGTGSRAEAIVAMANELGLYVHRDEQLLRELQALREGDVVPKQLFGVIATILAFSYLLQGRTPEAYTREDGTRAINSEA